MYGYLFLFFVVFIMAMSMKTLFAPTALQEKFISWESFIYLVFIYITIFLGFGLIYFIFIQNGYDILLDNGEFVGTDTIDGLKSCFYFSGITLFSVGYGDITPYGIGRFIAIMEALTGYTIKLRLLYGPSSTFGVKEVEVEQFHINDIIME